MARKRKKREAEEAGFGEEAAPAQDRPRMTPVDIQQKVFRLAFRGYNERDVDEFLDQITEDLAALHEENKRLREQVQEGGGGPGLEEANSQAEAIVRQAREHAARLVEDAGQRAGGSSPAPIAASFLVQERQFLQQLATLVQNHARRLKDEARRSREQAEPATGTEPASPPAASAGPPDPPRTATPVEASAEVAPAAGAAAVLADSPGVEEQTAPWSPVEAQPEREEPPASEPASADDRDPLVSAWESGFSPGERDDDEEAAFGTAGTAGTAYAERSAKRKGDEGEPSLRELFWGEE